MSGSINSLNTPQGLGNNSALTGAPVASPSSVNANLYVALSLVAIHKVLSDALSPQQVALNQLSSTLSEWNSLFQTFLSAGLKYYIDSSNATSYGQSHSIPLTEAFYQLLKNYGAFESGGALSSASSSITVNVGLSILGYPPRSEGALAITSSDYDQFKNAVPTIIGAIQNQATQKGQQIGFLVQSFEKILQLASTVVSGAYTLNQRVNS